MAGAALYYNVTPWCSVAQGAIQQRQTVSLLTIDHNCKFFDKNNYVLQYVCIPLILFFYTVKEQYRCCVIGADVAMQPTQMVFTGMTIFTSLLSSQNGYS